MQSGIGQLKDLPSGLQRYVPHQLQQIVKTKNQILEGEVYEYTYRYQQIIICKGQKVAGKFSVFTKAANVQDTHSKISRP
jgi:hypothetical protein